LNFDLSPSPQDQIKGFVAEAKERGYTSIGVIHGSSAYGETFGPAVESAMSEAGITVVGNEEYDVAALDMTPQLQALQSRRPQAVVVDGYGAPVGYLLQSMERLGWDVPLLGNVSVAATSLVSTDPPAGVLGTPQVANLTMEVYKSTSHDPGAARVNEMVATMRRLGEIQAALIVAYNYDGLFLAAAAAQDAGSTDAEAMARSMEKPQVQQAANTAVLDRYNFSDTSHSPNADPSNFLFISPSRIQDGQFGHGAGA
jgi:branched-chain amino acid transport system substrate-binding protein